jgi:sugar/nucleoside kinase (ribokinase family)
MSESTQPDNATDRQAIAVDAAAGLRRFAERLNDYPVMVGFDGFVDSIIDVVDKRHGSNQYDPIETIDAFGQRIQSSAGQSANFELVTKLEKLGGNGPIMANALARFGLPVSYVGCLGYPNLHPAFEELAEVAEVYPICDPGYTDALEFTDGKLMLGKHINLRDVNYPRIKEIVGEETFINLITRAELLGMVNWTMLVTMDSLWDALMEEVFPKLPQRAQPPMLFIDLCDPAKRLTEDIEAALKRIGRLNQHTRVVLGLNLNESTQIAQILGLPTADQPETSIEETARAIRAAMDLQGVVVHPRTSAAGAWLQDNGEVTTGRFEGPFTNKPRLSTGAGDNFNAGFCLGLLADLPLQQALCVGTATSGHYVRNAQSPTLHEVASFCDALPDPEPAPTRPGA